MGAEPSTELEKEAACNEVACSVYNEYMGRKVCKVAGRLKPCRNWGWSVP